MDSKIKGGKLEIEVENWSLQSSAYPSKISKALRVSPPYTNESEKPKGIRGKVHIIHLRYLCKAALPLTQTHTHTNKQISM